MHPRYPNTQQPILIDDIVFYKPKNDVVEVTNVGLTSIGCIISMTSKHTRESYSTDNYSDIEPATPEQIKWYRTDTNNQLLKALDKLKAENKLLLRIEKPTKQQHWQTAYSPANDVYIVTNVPADNIGHIALWHVAHNKTVHDAFGDDVIYITRDDIHIVTQSARVTPNVYDIVNKVLNDEPYDILNYVPNSTLDIIMEQLDSMSRYYDIDIKEETDLAREILNLRHTSLPDFNPSVEFWGYKYQSYIKDIDIKTTTDNLLSKLFDD